MIRIWTLMVVLTMAGVAAAQEARPLAENPQVEARLKVLAVELRCLVCQNQSIDDSNADLARDLRKLVRDLERTYRAMGDGVKKIYESEKAPIVKMGKSLVVARDLPSGHVLSADDIVMKSPGGGIPPYELNKVLGRVTLKALYADDFLTFEVLGETRTEFARS